MKESNGDPSLSLAQHGKDWLNRLPQFILIYYLQLKSISFTFQALLYYHTPPLFAVSLSSSASREILLHKSIICSYGNLQPWAEHTATNR